INDVIAHGGRLIGKADNTYHTAGGTKLGPHGIGLFQVDKDVTGKQWLELLGALACLDRFHFDFRVKTGDDLILQMLNRTITLGGLVLKGVPGHAISIIGFRPRCIGVSEMSWGLPPAVKSTIYPPQ